MLVRIEQGDPWKDIEKHPNEGSDSRTGKNVIDVRAHWKVKSSGSCGYLDARAKEREERRG